MFPERVWQTVETRGVCAGVARCAAKEKRDAAAKDKRDAAAKDKRDAETKSVRAGVARCSMCALAKSCASPARIR